MRHLLSGPGSPDRPTVEHDLAEADDAAETHARHPSRSRLFAQQLHRHVSKSSHVGRGEQDSVRSRAEVVAPHGRSHGNPLSSGVSSRFGGPLTGPMAPSAPFPDNQRAESLEGAPRLAHLTGRLIDESGDQDWILADQLPELVVVAAALAQPTWWQQGSSRRPVRRAQDWRPSQTPRGSDSVPDTASLPSTEPETDSDAGPVLTCTDSSGPTCSTWKSLTALEWLPPFWRKSR